MSDARRSPTLLADVLAGGRVIADRDGRWDQLRSEQDKFAVDAAGEEADLLIRARRALSAAAGAAVAEIMAAAVGELAARALSEGVRLGALPTGEGGPWQRLAALGVITRTSAQRLRGAREARNDLAHDYLLASFAAIHAAGGNVLGELDGYVIRWRSV